MQAWLGNLGQDKAIVDTENMTNTITLETLKKAKNTIIQSLDDQVLRRMSREVSISTIWKKLEEIYMVKSLFPSNFSISSLDVAI